MLFERPSVENATARQRNTLCRRLHGVFFCEKCWGKWTKGGRKTGKKVVQKAVSEEIRKILLGGENTEMCDETEALLFAAARVQHIKEKILPAVAAGKTIVCDRYVHSSLVYQGYARGLGDFVEKVNSYALENCMPDVTIFLDITPERAFARKGGADKDDRLEQSGMDFHKRVYDGYVKAAEKFPDHFVRINADRPVEEVFEDILSTLESKGVIIRK